MADEQYTGGAAGAPAAPALRDAADLAFMVETSRTVPGALMRRVAHDRTGLEPGDIVEEGYLLEVDAAADEVRVTRVRHVADDVLSDAHFSYRTVRYESESMSFREFAESGWMVDVAEKWGDGDPDARQVGNASAEAAPDGTRATARVDAGLQDRGWPRRGIGRFHDDLEATVDSSGRLTLRSESMGALYDGTFAEALELIGLGGKCREAGVEFEGGRVCVPAARGSE